MCKQAIFLKDIAGFQSDCENPQTEFLVSKFYYQLIHNWIVLKKIKIYIKIDIKTAPTCFGVIIIRERTIWSG